MKAWVLLSITALLACWCVVHASIGDRLPTFRHCVSSCEAINCGAETSVTSRQLPFHLRLLFWDCSQNCDYNCQRITTRELVSIGEPVVQFHGKWPFYRMFGVQEPASVLFSVLNFVPHLQGLKMLLRSNRDESNYNVHMRKFYMAFAIIGMNAWVWSSVFHMRDFLVTERLDYFSAGLTILYGFYCSTVRILRLDKAENRLLLRLLTVACVGVYVAHVGYLSLIRFSYSYNMAFGVTVGMIQNVLWSYHAFSTYNWLQRAQQQGQFTRKRDNTWALWPFFIVTAVAGGMAFELFDFSPLGYVLDAHALWHAATILPTYWWYWWMKRDIHHLKSLKEK